MDNKSRKKKRRFHILKDMRIRQRMLLVYILGCIIPFVIATFYTNSQTTKMMVSLSKETQSEELSLIAASVRESMNVAENVSTLMCKNNQVKKIAETKYPSGMQFLYDYANMKALNNYLDYYERDISRITIYVKNSSISPKYMLETPNIKYLSDSVTTQKWYHSTVTQKKGGYWSYANDPETNKLSLQVTQAMRNEKGQVIALVSVLMQHMKTGDAIDERNVDTMLLYNDYETIYSNFGVEKNYAFLIENLDKEKAKKYSKKTVYQVEEYQVTYERIQPTGSKNYYSLVSVQKYQNIMTKVNKISLNAFLPGSIGVVASIILIFVFALFYEKRMTMLGLQMHRVAQGDFALVEPIEGDDEVGELYLELEQMMHDIQKLMANVVDEQVQKEKLHTRQKEVEFKMLASQINPHFLYNTLETIRMKAMVNKQSDIEELVKMLAKIMRYNIQVTDRMVSLASEIQMVEYYLKIQNYRFGDRIVSRVIVDDDVDLKAQVMPLIIQPFVENAFVHGLEQKDSDGILIIEVSVKENELHIIIKDNGKGMDYYRLGKLRKSLHEENIDGSHIGVHNVNQRIELQYGEEYGVRINSTKDVGTKVTLVMPYVIS